MANIPKEVIEKIEALEKKVNFLEKQIYILQQSITGSEVVVYEKY